MSLILVAITPDIAALTTSTSFLGKSNNKFVAGIESLFKPITALYRSLVAPLYELLNREQAKIDRTNVSLKKLNNVLGGVGALGSITNNSYPFSQIIENETLESLITTYNSSVNILKTYQKQYENLRPSFIYGGLRLENVRERGSGRLVWVVKLGYYADNFQYNIFSELHKAGIWGTIHTIVDSSGHRQVAATTNNLVDSKAIDNLTAWLKNLFDLLKSVISALAALEEQALATIGQVITDEQQKNTISPVGNLELGLSGSLAKPKDTIDRLLNPLALPRSNAEIDSKAIAQAIARTMDSENTNKEKKKRCSRLSRMLGLCSINTDDNNKDRHPQIITTIRSITPESHWILGATFTFYKPTNINANGRGTIKVILQNPVNVDIITIPNQMRGQFSRLTNFIWGTGHIYWGDLKRKYLKDKRVFSRSIKKLSELEQEQWIQKELASPKGKTIYS